MEYSQWVALIFMKNLLICTLSLMTIVPAMSVEFPLKENDFDGWSEAISKAMELDFLTTTSHDVRALFGDPEMVGNYDYKYSYSYYCPDNLPQLQRLRQVYPQKKRKRIWILLEFDFSKKDDKLMRVKLEPFETPIPEVG